MDNAIKDKQIKLERLSEEEYKRELGRIGYIAFIKQAPVCNLEMVSAAEVLKRRSESEHA